MRYLKKYNETTVYISDCPMKWDIDDIFLELKEDYGFYIKISIREEIKEIKNQFCVVKLGREKKFEYSDISEEIERLKNYMANKNFFCESFTGVVSIDGEVTPRVNVEMNRAYNRLGDGTWTERWYSFEIKFKSLK